MQLGKSFSMYIPGRIIGILLLITILVSPALIDPDHSLLPDCYFKKYTGYSCPSCGLTHSFHETSHLNFNKAFSYHLLGPILYFGLMFYLVKLLVETITKRRIQINLNRTVRWIAIVVIAGSWIGFWLIRFIGELRT